MPCRIVLGLGGHLSLLHRCRRMRLAFATVPFGLAASVNQARWQTQRLPQALFCTRHLAMITFVIITGEMQHSMQRQNFNLFRWRVSEQARILRRHLG